MFGVGTTALSLKQHEAREANDYLDGNALWIMEVTPFKLAFVKENKRLYDWIITKHV
jgi:hypothetical protein